MTDKQFALALCGGGAKGSYQIGVWKAFLDFGIYKNITAFSGTSVGALNAVMMAMGDFNLTKKLWSVITKKNVLQFNPSGNSIFNRYGLEELLNNLDFSCLRNSQDVFINTYNVNSHTSQSHHLNNKTKEEIIQLLLASSAIPFIYKPVRIGTKKYIDGGINAASNVPVKPLYNKGYRNIWISALESNFSLYDITNPFSEKYDFSEMYPNANFTVISPTNSSYNFFSTLDFSRSEIFSHMIDGYCDTKKYLNKERIYYMSKNYSALNIEIEKMMKNMFKTKEELETFVRLSDFSKVNIETYTSGGKVWYKTIANICGWKLQQHSIPGMKGHYRLLDDKNRRRAWVLNPDKIIDALDKYKAHMEFDI